MSTPQTSSATSGGALKVTLADALERAKRMSPTLERVAADVKIADESRHQLLASNLPTVTYTTQYLYTQGNGTLAARYIANNGVHEYISQGNAHEVLSATQIVDYRRSLVTVSLARDNALIAQRGLTVAVVQSYATLVASEHKYKTVQQVATSARDFLNTTRDLERGGEIAHADVVKAEIQSNDRQIDLQEAQLARERDRSALALLLFPDVNQDFVVVDDLDQFLKLPSFAEAQDQALHHNPDLAAANDTVRASAQDVTSAQTGYLPTLTFDYFYGIDANHFATRTDRIQNLGYSALATLNLPIWNWGSTHSKVKQAEYRREQAVADQHFTQRKLTTDLQQFYREARVTHDELAIRNMSAERAEESLKLTLLQYKAGNATALEVVTAQDALSVERNAYDDTQARYATALANLATLTGTL
ncbi:MAG: TolC family protein [Acidobacteriaceae bacterium]